MSALEMLVAVLIPLGFFLMVFGIIYMYKRENLAMIEKGMNPKESASRPAPYKNLKWAMLLMGAGAGLFVAFFLDTYLINNTYFTETYGQQVFRHRHVEEGTPAIYFALIALGGGFGLFVSYKMEKKWWDENKPSRQA